MLLGGGSGAGTASTFVRYFSRKSTPNPRNVNPTVPLQEATSIGEGLYHLIKQHGPLTVSNTWNHAKEAGISGLNSKTHMKAMLKWMTGRKMLKLFCRHVGSGKKFLHCTLPEEPRTELVENSLKLKMKTRQLSTKRKK